MCGTESYVFNLTIRWIMPHHKDMRPHMAHTLQALRDQLEPAAGRPVP
jgi:hypothetical protein